MREIQPLIRAADHRPKVFIRSFLTFPAMREVSSLCAKLGTANALYSGMNDSTTYEATGWRYIDKCYEDKPAVGAALANSRVWDGDAITDDELDGTCAWATQEACERYAQYSKGCGWIVEIGGSDCGTAGEMVDEILIGDAVVLQITDW